MKSENHSLHELRFSLKNDAKNHIDLITIIENHHDYLKECAITLTSPTASAEYKQEALILFLHILKIHAKAEEETLYRELLQANTKEVRILSLSSHDEHNLADELAAELESLQFKTNWSEQIEAKAKSIAVLVRNHIKAEEKYVLPLAPRYINADRYLNLTKEYIERCSRYLENEMLEVDRAIRAELTPQGRPSLELVRH